MKRTRHLLLLLLWPLCFTQPSVWAQGTATPVASTQIERSELPMILASVYEHWEKDLLPSEASHRSMNSASSSSMLESWVPKVALLLLLATVGVMVVGDAARLTTVREKMLRKDT